MTSEYAPISRASLRRTSLKRSASSVCSIVSIVLSEVPAGADARMSKRSLLIQPAPPSSRSLVMSYAFTISIRRDVFVATNLPEGSRPHVEVPAEPRLSLTDATSKAGAPCCAASDAVTLQRTTNAYRFIGGSTLDGGLILLPFLIQATSVLTLPGGRAQSVDLDEDAAPLSAAGVGRVRAGTAGGRSKAGRACSEEAGSHEAGRHTEAR